MRMHVILEVVLERRHGAGRGLRDGEVKPEAPPGRATRARSQVGMAERGHDRGKRAAEVEWSA